MDIDAIFQAYVETALWSSTDNADDSGGEPLDANYSADDIDEQTLAQMRKDCADFVEYARNALVGAELSDESIGHNFWLNRNGHGAGFWDLGIAQGDELSKLSKSFGYFDLYVGENGKIDGM